MPSFGGLRRGGLTLLEVIVAIVLLATLLVGVLVATGRHLRQIRAADQRRQAIEIADGLLAQWLRDPQRIHVPASGKSRDGFIWRTRELPSTQVLSLGLRIVRVEIMDEKDQGTEGQRPLAAVEIAIARPVETSGTDDGRQ